MDDQPPRPLAVPPLERDDADPDTPARRATPQTAPPPLAAPREGRSVLRTALWLLLVLLVVGGLVSWVVWRAGGQPAPAGRVQSSGPTPVGTATVAKGD